MTEACRDIDGSGIRISRRRLLNSAAGIGLGATFAPLLAACGGEDEATTTAAASGGTGEGETLNILTWEGYHDTAWLQEFGDTAGITVKAQSVGAPAEMFAKIKASPASFDIIYNTAGWYNNYVDADLILPIDEERIPNLKLISDVFPWREATSVDGTNYGVLYNWGDVPLGWASDEVPGNYDISQYVNSDGAPYDWNILWDPQFEGQVSIFDSPTDVFPMIGLAAGLEDPYDLTPEELEIVKQKLFDLRPQVTRLTTGFDDQINQFAAGEAIIGYINNPLVIIEVNKTGTKMDSQHITKQGTPAWSDNATITAEVTGAKLDAAYTFINEGLTIPWMARQIAATGNNGTLDYEQATSPEAKAAGLGTKQLETTLIPATRDAEFFPSLKFYQPSNVLEEQLEIWDEFKLGLG